MSDNPFRIGGLPLGFNSQRYGSIEDWPRPSEDFPLNALARNETTDAWQPVHLDEANVQRDRRGLRIMPFKSVRVIGFAGVMAWMEENNIVPVRLYPLPEGEAK